MVIWYIVCAMLGSAVSIGIICLVTEKREDALFQDVIGKLVHLDTENLNLRSKVTGLKAELEAERYRHDRVQDFCVALGKQLDAAKADLKNISACFTCGESGVRCGVKPEPDIRCGNYRWRGEADCHVADAPRNDGESDSGADLPEAGSRAECGVRIPQSASLTAPFRQGGLTEGADG